MLEDAGLLYLRDAWRMLRLKAEVLTIDDVNASAKTPLRRINADDAIVFWVLGSFHTRYMLRGR